MSLGLNKQAVFRKKLTGLQIIKADQIAAKRINVPGGTCLPLLVISWCGVELLDGFFSNVDIEVKLTHWLQDWEWISSIGVNNLFKKCLKCDFLFPKLKT